MARIVAESTHHRGWTLGSLPAQNFVRSFSHIFTLLLCLLLPLLQQYLFSPRAEHSAITTQLVVLAAVAIQRHQSFVMARLLAVSLAILVPLVWAFTRFDPICTVPSSSVAFMGGPDVRGTLDILWSCLFTIFACTWTIQHLNIPEQRDPNEPTASPFLSYLSDQAEAFWISAKWMIIAVLAPELTLAKAVAEFASAVEFKRRVHAMAQEMGIEDEVTGWGLTQSFFVMMGGIRAVRDDGSNAPGQGESPSAGQAEGKAEPDPEGAAVRTVSSATHSQPAVVCEPFWAGRVLYADELLELRQTGAIRRMPDITTEEIQDKSKSNILVKAIAVMQVLWVCVEIVVRTIRRLPVSQLEIAVAAHSICAIITYIFYFFKLKSVGVPARPIRLEREDNLESFENIGEHPCWYVGRSFIIKVSPSETRDVTGDMDCPARKSVPNDFVHRGDRGLAFYSNSIVVGAWVFGAIHVAGWNLVFPTPVEQLLWRIASILVMALLPAYYILGLAISLVVMKLTQGHIAIVARTTARTHGLCYVVARLFLLVEIFRSLGFLPPGVFVSTWVSNVPSFG